MLPHAALARPGSHLAPGPEATSTLGGHRVKDLLFGGGIRTFGSCQEAGAAVAGRLREPVFLPVSGR